MNKTERSKKRLLRALENGFGNVSDACRLAGVGRTTFYEWMKEDEAFRQEVANTQETLLDAAESELQRQIREGNTIALLFFLKTKGKSRGYSEKAEAPPVPDKAFQDLISYFAEIDRKQGKPAWLNSAIEESTHTVIFKDFSMKAEERQD